MNKGKRLGAQHHNQVNRPTRVNRESVVVLYAEGVDPALIAEKFGCTKPTVMRLLAEAREMGDKRAERR